MLVLEPAGLPGVKCNADYTGVRTYILTVSWGGAGSSLYKYNRRLLHGPDLIRPSLPENLSRDQPGLPRTDDAHKHFILRHHSL